MRRFQKRDLNNKQNQKDYFKDDERDNATSNMSNYTNTSLDETVPKEEPFDTSSEYLGGTNDSSSYDTSSDVQQPNKNNNNNNSHQQPYQEANTFQQRQSFNGDPNNYSSDQFIKDENIEDEWKKEIKSENLYSYDHDKAGFEASMHTAPNQHSQIQPSLDGWIADKKVPQGWKRKTTLGNNKTLVC